MAAPKLVGQNYTTPDLVAKVTGQAKYAEDFRVDGMLFARLLLSPMPHARVRKLNLSAALAMPGVKAIITADDIPAPAATVTDLGQTIQANMKGERALASEPMYQGEPVLAVAAVDELTAVEAGDAAAAARSREAELDRGGARGSQRRPRSDGQGVRPVDVRRSGRGVQ